MVTRRHPDVADLVRLGRPHELAISIYVRTDPGDREGSRVRVKAAVDEALRVARTQGSPAADLAAVRGEWDELARGEVWMALRASLALFIADDGHEVYVLPNELDDEVRVSGVFDVGQLVRAVTTPQEAYALTLSAQRWSLWHATARSRAQELDLADTHPGDVAEATNRATVRGRGHARRLVGDEGHKVLLERYAALVGEAVDVELRLADPDVPLFLFATAPLRDLYAAAHRDRPLVVVDGAADELSAHEVDAAIRTRLPSFNASRVDELVEQMMNGSGAGRVASDLAEIARGAVVGAVDSLVFDLTARVGGRLDPVSGALSYADDGADLLSAIAVAVLDRGGRVVAVRPGELSAPGWPGTALASLRHPLG